MGVRIRAPGTEAYYPDFSQKSDRKVTILDYKIIVNYRTRRWFIRYLVDGLMEHFVEDCHKNIANEYDNVIVIEGKEGTGKSSLAIRLAKALNPNFNMETDYIYSYEELVQAITDKEHDDRGRVFWLDETSSIMNNRDSMTSSSKNMVELLEMMRSRGWTLIMCIPSVQRLDKYLRDYRIRYLIEVIEDSWEKVYTEKSRGYYCLQFKTGDSYETFRTVAYGKFDPMTEEERKEYKAIKLRSQERKLNEIAGIKEKKPDGRKEAGTTGRNLGEAILLLKEMGLSNDELAAKFGYDKHTIENKITQARRRREKGANEDDDKGETDGN